MNAIFFGCKRAFHSCMHIARQVLVGYGLTPARFDMLTAIERVPTHSCAQRALRTALGVSAATISRMLRSLEDIGLVVRTRNAYPDRRTHLVELTALGLKCIRKASRSLVRSGAIQFAVECALTENQPYDEALALFEMDRAEWFLDRIRHAFGDIATLHYAWHPDD